MKLIQNVPRRSVMSKTENGKGPMLGLWRVVIIILASVFLQATLLYLSATANMASARICRSANQGSSKGDLASIGMATGIAGVVASLAACACQLVDVRNPATRNFCVTSAVFSLLFALYFVFETENFANPTDCPADNSNITEAEKKQESYQDKLTYFGWIGFGLAILGGVATVGFAVHASNKSVAKPSEKVTPARKSETRSITLTL